MRIGNGKLDAAIIEKLINANQITAKEIDVLFWIARRQDAYGRTFGVKYYDVCTDTSISIQEYYNCISGLEIKNFVRVINRNSQQGWDVEILGNIFATSQDDKKRYLNINKDIFYSESFINLKANEKKLLIRILLEKRSNNKAFFMRIDTLMNWIGIDNIQLMNSYILKLKKFFQINLSNKTKGKNSLFVIIPNYQLESILNRTSYSIKAFYFKHKLKCLCRQYNAPYDETNINDILILLNQYGDHLNTLEHIIIDTIHEKGSLEPKLINYIMNSKLNNTTSLIF